MYAGLYDLRINCVNMDETVSNKICNIKLSIIFKYPIHKINLDTAFTVSKEKKSFIILRSSLFSFVISFFKPNFANVTGIKNFSELGRLKNVIAAIFGEKSKYNIRIDNLSVKINIPPVFCTCQQKQIFLPLLVDFIAFHKTRFNIKSVSFDADIFSAMFIKFNDKDLGTFLIFKSGKSMLMGTKKQESITQACTRLEQILKSYILYHVPA